MNWIKNKKTLYTTFLLSALLALSVFLPACQGRNQKVVLQEGDFAPLFSLKDLDGKRWSLKHLKGRVVLLNFWAPWCPPCRAEMPSLQQLSNRMKNNPDFVILTILYRQGVQDAIRFLKNNNLSLTVLLDESMGVSKRYGVTGVPETYVIDKRGVLRRKIIGPMRFDTPEALQFFNTLAREQL